MSDAPACPLSWSAWRKTCAMTQWQLKRCARSPSSSSPLRKVTKQVLRLEPANTLNALPWLARASTMSSRQLPAPRSWPLKSANPTAAWCSDELMPRECATSRLLSLSAFGLLYSLTLGKRWTWFKQVGHSIHLPLYHALLAFGWFLVSIGSGMLSAIIWSRRRWACWFRSTSFTFLFLHDFPWSSLSSSISWLDARAPPDTSLFFKSPEVYGESHSLDIFSSSHVVSLVSFVLHTVALPWPFC